ncbi:kinase-like protein [Cucurbitaria berberidis CBS 394.84]|uniref:EKC/KEOPS complex subunit BUD32 n=1 Tax=Cucurbitaria berberidis CBS 394.84 TaxID=1168544 RepID=A0A9P4G9T4_9PLEO|nr:kinase-like protein [Cucurbitaria berberidis CBS 394.84]KAF1841512.1 kinase-like protein [Cucurbitaria berberidis CBS 394.84]
MNPFEFRPWYPKGVTHFIAAGASNYIAAVNKDTVLKFPLVPPKETDIYTSKGLDYRRNIREAAVKGLDVEEKILNTLGQHPRIIRLIRTHEDGLVLEYMPNGSVERYLRDVAPDTSLKQRLKWTCQAAEALAYAHGKNVLHCDFSVGNLLLDRDLTIKLCDFQGRLLHSDGTVILDGGAAEGSMSSMPRPDRNYCDRKTDIFALGTAIYFMVTGQTPYPELDTIDDEDEIRKRFEDGVFPPLARHQGGDVVRSCWKGCYESATEVMLDLQTLF